MTQLQPSEKCFAMVRKYESCRLKSYWDADGKVWTCGWGSTGADVTEGTQWTQEYANARLETDVMREWREMCAFVNVPLTQGQVDALTDFTYNEGSGRLRTSALLFHLNAGEYDRVPTELGKWIFSGGKAKEWLKSRRAAECELWEGA